MTYLMSLIFRGLRMRYFVLVLVFFLVSCSEDKKILTNELVINQGSLQGYEEADTNYYL